MKVTANSAFRAVHQCQILEVGEGDELVGDIAVYLVRSGADVSAADDDAEALVDEIEDSRAAGESPAVDALPESVQRTEEPGTRVVEEKKAPEPVEVEQDGVVVEAEQPAEEPAVVAETEQPAEVATPTETIDVTKSTISEVMAWVGNDVERAIAAFDAESDRGDEARKTLLDQLTKIAEA